MTTKKLFWEDPYMKECQAKVTSVDGKEVKLDPTIFYAFSGGQASDSGTIGEIPVEKAVANEDIFYVLEREPNFGEGDKVKVKIDWDRRYKIMKLHSAAHLIFFLFKEKTGKKKIIGSNVSERKSRLDYEYPERITPLLPEIEEKANEIISQGKEVKTYPDEENPRKRWWESGEWKCPCGGTHVKNLKEIGKLKLKRKNIGAGKERIEIKLAE